MDFISYTKYFAALAAIIIILLALAYIFKKFTQSKPRVSAQNEDIFNSKSSSLFIQEVLPIDQKNKIIIVGRDNLRHVILLGESHSNLIETVTPSDNPVSQSNFTATSQVGSITTSATSISPMTAIQSSEPDLNDIETEVSIDEPKITTSIINNAQDAEIAEIITQVENDMSPKDQPNDTDIASDADSKDIKSKLEDAKDLAKAKK